MTRKTNTAHGSVPDNAVWNVNSLQDECAGEKDLENLHQELPMDGVTGTSNIETQFDDKETAKILRKIDLRLLPVLTILYILSYLDRGNLGNAKVAGMNTDLSLTGTQYNIALTLFFLPYTLFEIPSNVALKLTRPSIWMATLVISWGSVMVGQGFVTGYHSLLTTRILLGVCEAGFFPASAYLIGDWYCRFELQWRMSLFFSAASMAGGFSGLLAFALEKMDGVGQLAGWRWIFIMEGLVTVLVGFSVPWILPDSPARASFLTPEEKAFVKDRLERDSGHSSGRVRTAESFNWKSIQPLITDWKIYFTIFIYWGNTVPIYAFTYAAPTIIHQMGYTSAQAQLLTIPVYAVGTATTLFLSWLADRRHRRWPFVVIPYAIALIGAIGLLSTPHPRLPGLTYAFLFAIPAGVFPAVISLVAWVSNNLAPSWKRSVGIAMSIMFGNMGGLVGSNIYIASEAPHYWTGYGITCACLTIAIVCTFVLRFAYDRENKKRAKIPEEFIRANYSEGKTLLIVPFLGKIILTWSLQNNYLNLEIVPHYIDTFFEQE